MQTLNLDQITPDANQPRKYFGVEKMASLKDSIKKHGVISPLTVQKEGKTYLLIDGERRYRAATELKIKEVPVNIVASKEPFLRLLEQFHIQEQHESWSATEKALAIVEISSISKKSLKEVCELLSIPVNQVRQYMAFASLTHKQKFVDNQISLENAEKIKEIKTFAKKIKESEGKSFSKTDEGILEKVLIDKIKNREIVDRTSYTRIKDSLRTTPKLLDTLLNGKFDIDEEYVSKKAKGARYVRNLIQSANYVEANGKGYIETKNVKLTPTEIALLKRVAKTIKEILDFAE